MITPLPVFHMNAMAYSFMAMVTVGGCLIVLDRFHPKTWWSDVAASGATCLHYLGIMPSVLMGFPEQAVDRTHQVRFGFGAGVDPKLQKNFEARFGFPLIEAWAMTEQVLAPSLPPINWIGLLVRPQLVIQKAGLRPRLLMMRVQKFRQRHLVNFWCEIKAKTPKRDFFHSTIKTPRPRQRLGKMAGSILEIL